MFHLSVYSVILSMMIAWLLFFVSAVLITLWGLWQTSYACHISCFHLHIHVWAHRNKLSCRFNSLCGVKVIIWIMAFHWDILAALGHLHIVFHHVFSILTLQSLIHRLRIQLTTSWPITNLAHINALVNFLRLVLRLGCHCSILRLTWWYRILSTLSWALNSSLRWATWLWCSMTDGWNLLSVHLGLALVAWLCVWSSLFVHIMPTNLFLLMLHTLLCQYISSTLST